MTMHPLATFLRAAAPTAANPEILAALADYVQSSEGARDEALEWFDTTVGLQDGVYRPCAAARCHLDDLCVGDDFSSVIACLTADELAAAAAARMAMRNPSFDAALERARRSVRRIAADRMAAGLPELEPIAGSAPFAKWGARRQRHLAP
jgi:hypothetical protein